MLQDKSDADLWAHCVHILSQANCMAKGMTMSVSQSTTSKEVQSEISQQWVALKFCTDNHDHQMMKPTDFDDSWHPF